MPGDREGPPVWIGNGAADQRRLDICGEALDTFLTADNLGFQMAHSGWRSGKFDLVAELGPA